MRIRDLSGLSVCVLGYGREGQSVVRALETYALTCAVTIADRNAHIEVPQATYTLQTGDEWLRDLGSFDVIIKSPGVPPLPEIEAMRPKVTNSTQLFLDTVQEAGATVIGVTGSKGKSTTASLIAAILLADGRDAYLVGNIGVPALDFLSHAKKGTLFVMEMSSYQLMDISVSPSIAVVTSFFPEHLDYHGSLENYKEAKMHITRFQTPNDFVFYDAGSPGAKEIAQEGKGMEVACGKEDCAVRMEQMKLLGKHNLRNCALATMVCEHFQVERKTIRKVISEFECLPHRLQSLGTHHGIEWIDDAISTTPESAISALDALGANVSTMILGGQDRGLDFTILGNALRNSTVKTVILFPESGVKIRESANRAGADAIAFYEANSMNKAVELAKEHTPQGNICLLSTASPSYNMFKNFEEKGKAFAQAVLQE